MPNKKYEGEERIIFYPLPERKLAEAGLLRSREIVCDVENGRLVLYSADRRTEAEEYERECGECAYYCPGCGECTVGK